MSTITIGGTDRTEYFDNVKFHITRNKRTFNSLRAVLYGPNTTFVEGEEALATIDTFLEFGGLIQELKNLPTTVQNKYSLYATGYEQITDRRTVQVDYTATDAGDIANAMVTIMAGEGITVGNIDTGSSITLTSSAISIRDVMDEIALASGFVWFIDNDKKLYFQDDYNYTASTIPVDYEVVEVGRSLVGYANKVFVIGTDGIIATAEDTTEQTKMSGRFGSGVYGVVVRDSQADTQAKADAVATVELGKRAFDKKYVKIRSRSRIDVGEIYTGVTIPYTDVSSEDYAVDEVVIEGNGSSFWYTAKLEPYATATLSKNESWQNKFREFLNKANTDVNTVIQSSGGVSNVVVSPDEPTSASADTLWVDTDDWSNCNINVFTTSTAIDLTDGSYGQDRYILYASGSSTTITLPNANTIFDGTATEQTTAGLILRIKNVDTVNSIYVEGTGGNTIEQVATTPMYTLAPNEGKEFMILRAQNDWKVM